MLSNLKIQNYALINELDIDFTSGFTVITGETGSGKSILLGALSLLLGKRADTQVLLDKTKKCIVEGSFNIKDLAFNSFFEIHELDYSDITIVRREINQQGNSRAFINDTPVNLTVMKDLGDLLMDIHSQHKTLSLNNTDFQLAVIDSFAGVQQELKLYKQSFMQLKNKSHELQLLIEKEKQSKSDLDYFEFQFQELSIIKLQEDEQKELEKELEILTHAQDIKKVILQSLSLLNNNEITILSQLKENIKLIHQISAFHPGIDDLQQRLIQSNIELIDISKELEHIEDKITNDPQRLEIVNERLGTMYRLQQKHHVNSNSELIALMHEFSLKINDISNLDEHILKLQQELNKIEQQCISQANTISTKRTRIIPKLEKEITKTLHLLAMPDAQIKIEQTILYTMHDDGIDAITILFNANKGHELKHLSKVISGGELSRLMLSIKSTISQKNLLPTIIFDEIDTGVSGTIAGKIAEILTVMSERMQVITITHLPQIAAKGQNHYCVIKQTAQASTSSTIKLLNKPERIEEISKMLTGENAITSSVTITAKELLNYK